MGGQLSFGVVEINLLFDEQVEQIGVNVVVLCHKPQNFHRLGQIPILFTFHLISLCKLYL